MEPVERPAPVLLDVEGDIAIGQRCPGLEGVLQPVGVPRLAGRPGQQGVGPARTTGSAPPAAAADRRRRPPGAVHRAGRSGCRCHRRGARQASRHCWPSGTLPADLAQPRGPNRVASRRRREREGRWRRRRSGPTAPLPGAGAPGAGPVWLRSRTGSTAGTSASTRTSSGTPVGGRGSSSATGRRRCAAVIPVVPPGRNRSSGASLARRRRRRWASRRPHRAARRTATAGPPSTADRR